MTNIIRRYTNAELFTLVFNLAKASGELAKLLPIEDYHLPEGFDVRPLTRYEFDTEFIVNYGGSEGIYIDGYIVGRFDDSGKTRLKLCTIKTLEDDLEAMKIMGEVCGILTHFSHFFVNANLENFTT